MGHLSRGIWQTQSVAHRIAARPGFSDGAYLQIKDAILRLEDFPLLGRAYDPDYEAARPPMPCRVLYAGRYGVYYMLTDDAPVPLLVVLAIEDERRDSMRRFSGMQA